MVANNTTNFQDIQQFASTFDVQPVWTDGLTIDPKVLKLRAELIKEEVARELFPALQRFANFQSLENLTDVADALVDSVYVLLGCAVAMDLPWQELWDEVHRSNMAKIHADGTVHRREDGKILKPEGWTPPDLFKIIMRWYTERCLKDNPELRDQHTISDIRTKQA
jgi:predicted HAD superfamily Cof-like phosphohydrolase